MIIGFIGSGVMGSALARAVKKSGRGEVWTADIDAAKVAALAAEVEGKASSNEAIAREADYIFLAVKPQFMEGMLSGIRQILKDRPSRVQKLKELLGGDYPLIRIMPNTPASIGQGVVIYSPDNQVTEEETEAVVQMLSPAGKLVKLTEKQLDAGGCISGCGPAFVDLFVEALADGGVLCGLPRKEAQELAAQMVMGSAALI